MTASRVVELDGATIHRLLDRLDARLVARGVAGSVYVVGGAAIAMTIADGRRTYDVDAIASDTVVLEEAETLAAEEGLPPRWLNSSALPWVPRRPAEARAIPARAGLTVHVAPARHLLAMKIVAMRRTDIPDIVTLRSALGLQEASGEVLFALLRDVYDGEDELANLMGSGGLDEARLRCETVAAYGAR